MEFQVVSLHLKGYPLIYRLFFFYGLELDVKLTIFFQIFHLVFVEEMVFVCYSHVV